MTTKGNIINQIAQTLYNVKVCRDELKLNLTNSCGMVEDIFEKELTKGYIEANGVIEVMDELKNEVSKLEMLTKLISE
jgi:hypothetical protein